MDIVFPSPLSSLRPFEGTFCAVVYFEEKEKSIGASRLDVSQVEAPSGPTPTELCPVLFSRFFLVLVRAGFSALLVGPGA